MEDAVEGEKKDLEDKVESLESIVRMLELKSKNAADHGKMSVCMPVTHTHSVTLTLDSVSVCLSAPASVRVAVSDSVLGLSLTVKYLAKEYWSYYQHFNICHSHQWFIAM